VEKIGELFSVFVPFGQSTINLYTIKQLDVLPLVFLSGGSIWRPPPMNPYTQGMPEDLVEYDEVDVRKGTLSNTQRERLEDLLRNISPERMKVTLNYFLPLFIYFFCQN